MIYFLLILILIFSFFISYKINSTIKNFDKPGKNKIQKNSVLTSGGFFPFVILSLIISYFIYFSTLEYSSYYNNIPQIWMAALSILILTIISFYDDFNYIPFQVRLFVQLAIVYLCISLLPINQEFNFQTPIFNGMIPIKLDIIITIVLWTFIINSTNFIDGYDGMFSFQMITNFFALSIIFLLIEEVFHFQVSFLMLIIGIIFLPFNLGKKFKMYIGDAGSIPSGFILGWMIISLSNMGYFLSAFIINSFFLLDVLFTLLKRIIKKKSIFIRHNEFVFKNMIIKNGPKKYFSLAIPIQIIIILSSIYMVLK